MERAYSARNDPSSRRPYWNVWANRAELLTPGRLRDFTRNCPATRDGGYGCRTRSPWPTTFWPSGRAGRRNNVRSLSVECVLLHDRCSGTHRVTRNDARGNLLRASQSPETIRPARGDGWVASRTGVSHDGGEQSHSPGADRLWHCHALRTAHTILCGRRIPVRPAPG